MITIFKNLSNILDFALRKRLRISKGEYYPKNEPKENLYGDLEPNQALIAQQREDEYLPKYHFQGLKQDSKRRIYLENLAICELLETYLEISKEQDGIKILDIGSKNWFYATGEYLFFKYNNHNDRKIILNGIELDAYRLYTDFHSRCDYAKYHIKNLEGANYIVGDFLKHNEKYDYITWFFPFLTEPPLLQWGLPLSCLTPHKMLQHAHNSLRPNGQMIIMNQDKKEYLIQQDLLNSLGIPYKAMGLSSSSFIHYENERFVTVVTKNNK